MWQADGSAFNAMVQDTKRARDVARGAPVGVELHPWFAPRDFILADPGEIP